MSAGYLFEFNSPVVITGGTMFIDSHAHFDACLEQGVPPEELFEGTRARNVKYAVQISTEIKDFDTSIDIAESHDNILFSLGIHPTSHYGPDDFTKLDAKVSECLQKRQKLFGIGETGLDYHWMEHPKEEQERFFIEQLEIAKKHNLPVIVHSRDAFEDTYRILKESGVEKVIIHCFSGTRENAKLYIDLGYYISFAGNLTFKKAFDLHEAVEVIPDSQLLLETDCPYLTPVPHRGKKNMPAYVEHVYNFAAERRKTKVETLQESLYINFMKLAYLSEEA